MRRRCEPNSIKRLLIVDIRSSLDIVANWRFGLLFLLLLFIFRLTLSSEYDLMCLFFQQYLRVGCQAILCGVNQYKFFVFCFLPFFEKLDSIPIALFEVPSIPFEFLWLFIYLFYLFIRNL
jgi:hypothetical protein